MERKWPISGCRLKLSRFAHSRVNSLHISPAGQGPFPSSDRPVHQPNHHDLRRQRPCTLPQLYPRPDGLVAAKPLSKALLFFGCRDPELDDLYHDELSEFESVGVVKIYRAYSKVQRLELARGYRYVQDRLEAEAQAVHDLWAQDAIIYVCGSRNMAKGAQGQLEYMLGRLPEERYVTEIF